MIVALLINLIITILGVIFMWLPSVDTLPVIAGYDIDTAMVSGIAYMNRFFDVFWPTQVIFQGFLALISYYLIKMMIKPFLGHRAPHNT